MQWNSRCRHGKVSWMFQYTEKCIIFLYRNEETLDISDQWNGMEILVFRRITPTVLLRLIG